MRSSIFLCLSSVLILFVNSCYKEGAIFAPFPNDELELPLILTFDNKSCFFDEHSNSLQYAIGEDSITDFSPFVQFQEHSTILVNNIPLANNAINNLGTIQIKKTYDVCIVTNGKTKHFILQFTTLPLLRIVTRNKIVDEPKSLAQLTINSPNQETTIMTSYIGIELRGASSQFNPKKSYGFAFLNSMNMQDKVSKPLLGCKKNENWILDAVYNDQAKFRNKLSFDLWKKMNPTKHASIESQFVELYVNSSYQGIYCLNEQMNAEQLELLNTNGVIYKTVDWQKGTTFQSLSAKKIPEYTDFWDGWVQKYPEPKINIEWEPLYDLRNWVINTTDEQFANETSTQVDLENIIDYYLFINLIGANDNHGKNMIWVKPDKNVPFFIVPWDLDTSWGRDWDGQTKTPDFVGINSNQLFGRLLAVNPQNFRERLSAKWVSLRRNTWSNANMLSSLDNMCEQLIKVGVIEKDNARWGKAVDLKQERIYMQNWIIDQLNLLDIYFKALIL